MDQVKLERDFRSFYRFLKIVLAAFSLDFLPISWFPVRLVQMSIVPFISSISFVALFDLLMLSFREGDMVTFSYGAIWISATIQTIVKATTGMYYRDVYVEFFEGVQKLVRKRFDESVEVSVKKIFRNTINLTKIIVISQGCVFHITAYLLGFFAITTHRVFPLMYCVPFFSDIANHIFQWICVLLNLYTVLGGDFLFITMALHFRGELSIISEILGSFKNADFLFTVHLMHRDVLKKLRIFQMIYFHLTFLQMISSVLLICLSTFMIRFHDVQLWAYAALLCALMQIFFLCLIGDILFEKASNISTALYLTKWYEMEIKDQQRILIMIAMAQKPYGIKAAGLVDVSFFTFIEIVKLSVTYCAILFTLV